MTYNQDWKLAERITIRVLDGFIAFIDKGGSLGRFPENLNELTDEATEFLAIQIKSRYASND